MARVVVYFFIVLSIVNISRAFSLNDIIDTIGIACNGTKEDVNDLKRNVIPKTESGKCLMLCVNKFYPLTDSEGKYDPEETTKSLEAIWPEQPPEKVYAIAKHCETMLKDEPSSNYKTCQMAYDIASCVNKRARELRFFSHRGHC